MSTFLPNPHTSDVQKQLVRLRLLLDLSGRISSNLDFHELLRAISANVREVMQCDFVGVGLVEQETGMLRVFALDNPETKGAMHEGHLMEETPDHPGQRVLRTMQPLIVEVTSEALPAEGFRIAQAERLKTLCFIPLASRGRAVGILGIGRREGSFSGDDVEFLHQASGPIAIAIENALAFQEISELKDKLAQEKLYLEDEIRSEMGFQQIIGNSPALRHVLEMVNTVAVSDSTVLLLGETGTGKELIARAIHDHSRRKARTFVKLNCAAIPTGLLESELFGHERGAFTGAISQKIGRLELADQGSLFLDEVGDIPIEIQPKLLRALQEREFERLGSTHTRKVSVRLIAATNRNLEQMVIDREFRSDLFYRLNVFPIRIPPLRERREDIPLLVSFFVQKFSKQMQKKIDSIPSQIMQGLTRWDWPGNIRELENFAERAVILTRGRALEAPLAELRKPNVLETPSTPAAEPAREDIARIVKETLTALDGKATLTEKHGKQRDAIIRALTECKGQVGGADGAAARMGMSRTTLISQIKKFGIDPKNFS